MAESRDTEEQLLTVIEKIEAGGYRPRASFFERELTGIILGMSAGVDLDAVDLTDWFRLIGDPSTKYGMIDLMTRTGRCHGEPASTPTSFPSNCSASASRRQTCDRRSLARFPTRNPAMQSSP